MEFFTLSSSSQALMRRIYCISAFWGLNTTQKETHPPFSSPVLAISWK